MIKYEFSEGPLTIKNASKADPQVIGEELAKIEAECDGRLTPEAVVKAAENRRHPLHKHFEWSDPDAAHQHRLAQARRIIRIIRIVDNGEPATLTRAYLSISDRGGVSYRSADAVLHSRDLQLAVLRQAESDLKAWERRYSDLRDLCREVIQLRLKVTARRESLERDQPEA